MSDDKIISLYWQRSSQAISETDRKYGKYCHSIAWNILRDISDSEEAVNDCYLKAWNSMPPQRPAKLSAFLGRICRNVSINALKARTAQKRGGGEYFQSVEELDDSIRDSFDMQRQLELKELIDCIHSFLSELSDEDRNIFLSRYWYFVSIDEIAKISGRSNASVKTRLYRLRQRLIDKLKEEELC